MSQNEYDKKIPDSNDLDDDFELEELDAEEYDDESEDTTEARTFFSSKSTVMHVVFLSLIAILFIVSFYKLYKWNKGNESEYDPNEINTEFDTETEDFFTPLSADNAALQADDDITTVLLLGNSAVSAGGRGIADNLEKLIPQSAVYSCAFDNSYISTRNTVFEEKNPEDAYSLYWVANAMTTGDYSLLRNNLDKTEIADGSYESTIKQLEEIDYSTVDVLVLMYDATDYEDKRLVMSPLDLNEKVSYAGALKSSIEMIQQTYPHIRIIVSSPYCVMVENDNGELVNGASTDFGFGYLSDYMIAGKNIATTTLVSYIDNYNGTITTDNYEEYLEDDGYTLNADGQEVIAKRIAAFVTSTAE